MILQVHSPSWGLTAKPAGVSGLGCSCGGQCEPCKRRGVGDWSDDLMGMLSTPINLGFTTLPLWVVGGAALLLVWWLMTPGGADYRRAKRQLSAKYRGSTRLKRAARGAVEDLL